MHLEIVHECPICGGSSFNNLLIAKDYTTTREEFQIQKCSTCNFLLTNPRPFIQNIGRYYESENYISHSGKSSLFGNLYKVIRGFTLQMKSNLIKAQVQRSGKILDYGCGTGEFLQFMQARGWSISGIEPNEVARIKATALVSKKISGSLEEITNEKFDVITLWHVLEHIHQLNETLDKIKNSLQDNGTIFIAVPNPAAADQSYYIADWAAYDVPRHLWHFTKSVMYKLMHKHGLKIVEVKPMKLDSFYVCLLSEGNIHPERNKLINGIQALIHGYKSNNNARKTGEYSSLIYIVKKA